MMEGFKSQMGWKLGQIKEPFGWLSDTKSMSLLQPNERLMHFLSVTRERPQVETSSDLSRCCNWFNHLLILTLKYSVSMKQIRNRRVQERSNFFPAQNLYISLFLSIEPTMWYGYQKCVYPCSLCEILPSTVSRIRWSKPVQDIGIALYEECACTAPHSEKGSFNGECEIMLGWFFQKFLVQVTENPTQSCLHHRGNLLKYMTEKLSIAGFR